MWGHLISHRVTTSPDSRMFVQSMIMCEIDLRDVLATINIVGRPLGNHSLRTTTLLARTRPGKVANSRGKYKSQVFPREISQIRSIQWQRYWLQSEFVLIY